MIWFLMRSPMTNSCLISFVPIGTIIIIASLFQRFKMEFTFPQSMQGFAQVKDLSSLQSLLLAENNLLSSKIKYKCVVRKSKYLYARCHQKRCPSYLTFRLNQDNFELVKYQNSHNHGHNEVRATQYNKIEQELSDLPSMISTQASKLYICQKYRISHRCFYYLHQKIRNKKLSYLELFDFINLKQYQIHTDPFYHGMDQLPDVMIIVTPLMKENFKKFGNWMGFDFTFNLVQEIKEGKQQYRLGVFVGISASKKIVPFGLVLCNEQTKERYYQIFKSFSDIMNRLPEVIITDEDKAIISAIQTLKGERQFEGHHLLDCFHILRNVRKNLSYKQCWRFFNNLIRQRSKQAFQETVSECIDSMESQRDIQLLKRFLESSQKYCFGKTPPKLFGFMPNTAMNEKIHDLIKSIIPYSKPFTVVVKKVLLYLEQLGIKCHQYEIENTKHEVTFYYPPLKEIRYSVCKAIFKEIIFQFSKGLHHEVISYQQTKFTIKQGHQTYKLKQIDEKWRCQCQYLEKTGVFCSHLSKIVLIERLKLSDYIHPRWILSIQASNQVRKKYCFQKKTRRNRK